MSYQFEHSSMLQTVYVYNDEQGSRCWNFTPSSLTSCEKTQLILVKLIADTRKIILYASSRILPINERNWKKATGGRHT